MKLVISSTAREALFNARNFYNADLPGLGYEFVQEFIYASERIQSNPEAWTKLSKRTRRCLVHRFPFAVIFRIIKSKNEIQIIDLMHHKQKPRY